MELGRAIVKDRTKQKRLMIDSNDLCAKLQYNFNELATTRCRGLSRLREVSQPSDDRLRTALRDRTVMRLLMEPSRWVDWGCGLERCDPAGASGYWCFGLRRPWRLFSVSDPGL